MSASWFSISKSTLINILTKLQTVFDTKADSSHTHTKSDITDFAHDHPLSIEAASTATSAINLDPNAIYKLTAGGKTFIFKTPADSDHYAWADITGKPSSYPPSAHTHTVSQITDFPSTMPPSSHTHGNIQNGGTLQTNDVAIANGDKLVITDSSDSSKIARASISFDGSTATKCLTQKGTWATFLSSHQDISGKLDKSGGTMTGTLTTRSDNNNGDIVPTTDSVGSIGLANKRYATVYTNSLRLGKYGDTLGVIRMYNTKSGAEVYLSASGITGERIMSFRDKSGTLALTSDIEVSEDDIASSQTIKSSVVTVNDAAPINAEDITVDITPVQDLHGYDRPWAGGAWKNKLNYIDFKGVEGGTVTKSNGTLTITGTNGRTGANITGSLVNNLPAGTYTLSFNVVSITNYQNQPTFFGFIVKKSGGAYVYSSVSVSQTGTKSLTYTLSEGDKFERIDFNINDQSSALSNACTFEIKDIQVEEGSQATTFAPYSNECPIEGWTGAELDRVGKNWLSYSSDNVGWASDKTAIVDVLNSLPEGTYTLTVPFTLTSISGDITNAVCQVRIDTNFIPFFIIDNKTWRSATVGTTKTVTCQIVVDSSVKGTFKNCYLYGCGIDGVGARGTASVSNVQLELSSTPTAYEPYQGAQYTASFGETVYGGKWHVTAGGTDSRFGMVDLGDLDYEYMPGYNFMHSTNLSGGKDQGSAICSCYEYQIGVSPGETAFTIYVGQFYVSDSGYTDPAAFKAAVTGQKLVYELATPTTISTPKQNVPMLQGINTVSADCGDVSLKYQPDNVIGELKGEIESATDYVKPRFKSYYSLPYDPDQRATTTFSATIRLCRDRGYVSIVNVALTFWQNYPIADFYYEVQNPVDTEFIPEIDVEKLFLHINGQSFLNVMLTSTGILKLRMYSPVRIVDNFSEVFWLQTSDETGCREAKY